MSAAVLIGERSLAYTRVPVPAMAADMLLVRVAATGICGSDLATYRGRHPYKRPPVILGHEFTGNVVGMGERAAGFAIDDTVVTAAFLHCGRCGSCRRGAVNLCSFRRNLSHRGWEGSFAQYVTVHPDMSFAVPPTLPVRTAALVEPLSIAVHALNLITGPPGELTILGAGGIGLAALLLARWLGWQQVTCIDRGSAKGDLARTLGASGYIDAAVRGIKEQVLDRFGEGGDVTLVCTGYPGAVRDAVAATRPGGQIVVISYFEEEQTLDLNALVSREVTLTFSALSTPADSAQVIAALEAGFDPAALVTHTFDLDRAHEAMRLLDDNAGDVGKIILIPEPL